MKNEFFNRENGPQGLLPQSRTSSCLSQVKRVTEPSENYDKSQNDQGNFVTQEKLVERQTSQKLTFCPPSPTPAPMSMVQGNAAT